MALSSAIFVQVEPPNLVYRAACERLPHLVLGVLVQFEQVSTHICHFVARAEAAAVAQLYRRGSNGRSHVASVRGRSLTGADPHVIQKGIQGRNPGTVQRGRGAN